ncbi:P-type DNA transfer ATPase VirB11 [Salmonella enterica]|nr:P-type DNA transfer ATPase VirB11 [Salmonella enterica]EHI7937676.1 P-type DNA transfer ATPase VirB11 [Salmonella enterica]
MRNAESTLEIALRGLQPYFDIEGTNDIHINEPGIVITQGYYGKKFHEDKKITFDWCKGLAKLVANHSSQKVDESTPLLGTTLPSGQRIQVVLPPATPAGKIAIAIRTPTKFFTMDDLDSQGGFDDVALDESELEPHETELLELKNSGKIRQFIEKAIFYKKNIVCSGATSAGKTTYGNAFIECIPPDERLITLEDALENIFRIHKDVVRLLFSRGEQGRAKVTIKDLIEVVLRLNPDRVLLSELRGAEAFYYMRNVNSGHPGTITTVHANSPKLAIAQMILYIKESEAGRNLTTDDIRAFLFANVDVILQFHNVPGKGRKVTGIYYDPMRKRELINR